MSCDLFRAIEDAQRCLMPELESCDEKMISHVFNLLFDFFKQECAAEPIEVNLIKKTFQIMLTIFFSNAVGAPAGPRFHKRRYSIFASASNEHCYCFILFYSLNFYERGFRKEDSFLLPASVFWHFLLYQILMLGRCRAVGKGTGHTLEHHNLSIYDETK